MAKPFPVENWFPNWVAIRKSLNNTLSDAGDDVIVAIRRRTTEGRDVFGKPFHPYAAFTQQKKNTGPSPVTLVRTGRMLNSLRKTASSQGIRIKPTGPSNLFKARQHQFGFLPGNLPRRQWFGLSPAQRRRITKKYNRRVLRAVRDTTPRSAQRAFQVDLKVRI